MHAGDIVTIAGGPCTGSKPNPAPTALALDPAGDLFIAYSTGSRVEELPATTGTQFGIPVTAGRLVTIAGTGVSGYGGDGGPAPHGVLDDPSGLAVDPTGDLLIADTANCRLRLVAASTGTRYGVQCGGGPYLYGGRHRDLRVRRRQRAGPLGPALGPWRPGRGLRGERALRRPGEQIHPPAGRHHRAGTTG